MGVVVQIEKIDKGCWIGLCVSVKNFFLMVNGITVLDGLHFFS
jgi:hypothetical protein